MSYCGEGNFETKYGIVTARYPGRFTAPPNLQTYHQTDSRTVKLQGPALRAFKAAEKRITPKRMLNKGKVRHILITGQGFRSYELQKALYAVEPGRFADPDCSLHCEALAVDIDMNQGTLLRAKIKRALEAEGWHYAVSGEPWHASFRLAG